MIESAEEFVRLRASEDLTDQRRAANEEAQVSTWEEIIRAYPEMKFWVAQNKTVPVEILEILSIDRDERVRWMVAMKRRTPAAVLDRLAHDTDDTVRIAVAKNRNSPRQALEQLARDPVPSVRQAAHSRM